jgi:adenosylcobinamide amidohydrolase
MSLTESPSALLEHPAFSVTCRPPWLVARCDRPQRMLSWSLTRPGFARASTVAWLEVRNADLGPDTDADDLLLMKQRAAGLEDAIPFITSRDVRRHHRVATRVGDVMATCLVTVGLSNGDRVGMPRIRREPRASTINMLVHVNRPLEDGAMLETMSIATEARTAAVIELGWQIEGRIITGTGTDCIVIACPDHENGQRFAGLHTDIGEAVGTACYRAVLAGAKIWRAEQ